MCFSEVIKKKKKVNYLAGQVAVTLVVLPLNAVVGPWDTSARMYITPRCYPALGCVSPTYFLGCAVSEA